jgi:hypothetical protein
MEGEEVVNYQADEDQCKPENIALDKSVESIAEKTDQQEEVEKSEYVIKHCFLNYPKKYHPFGIMYTFMLDGAGQWGWAGSDRCIACEKKPARMCQCFIRFW